MKLLNISPGTKIELEKVVGKCIAVLGITGSGKTNTTAVILEEMLKHKYPMTIVDIDGEYWGLKQKYELLVVGKSKNVDIEVNVEHAKQIAEISISKNIPVILDMSGFLYEDTYEFLLNYFEEIWDLAGKYRKPYEIVLEEAHEFIPQGNKNDLKEILTRIALRGRKRGLGSIILSQRSAKVEKDILTQAEILFLHKVVHPSDLKVYKEILPLSNKDVHKLISSLNVGDCIFLFENNFELIHLRERETFHAGFTPSLMKVKSPKLKVVSNEILKSIQTLTKTKIKEKSDLDRLQTKVHKLEANISEKNIQIQKLERDLEILGRISVEVHQPNISPHISESMVEHIIANMLKQNSKVENYAADSNIQSIEYETLPKNVKEHINKIIRRINKLTKPKKEILKFLVNRSPQSYTYSDMAEWINYSESTLYKNQPTELIKMKIIDRRRKADGFHYYATIDNFVKKEFQVYFQEEDIIYLKFISNYLRKKIQ